MNPVVHFSNVSAHWATPLALYGELNREFNFTLDPCPFQNRTVDGLVKNWGGAARLLQSSLRPRD